MPSGISWTAGAAKWEALCMHTCGSSNVRSACVLSAAGMSRATLHTAVARSADARTIVRPIAASDESRKSRCRGKGGRASSSSTLSLPYFRHAARRCGQSPDESPQLLQVYTAVYHDGHRGQLGGRDQSCATGAAGPVVDGHETNADETGLFRGCLPAGCIVDNGSWQYRLDVIPKAASAC